MLFNFGSEKDPFYLFVGFVVAVKLCVAFVTENDTSWYKLIQDDTTGLYGTVESTKYLHTAVRKKVIKAPLFLIVLLGPSRSDPLNQMSKNIVLMTYKE